MGKNNVNENIKYVEDIKKCSCSKKLGDAYVVTCKIQQRGEHDYVFIKNTDYITKEYSNKTLNLSQIAKKKISETIECFDGDEQAIRSSYIKVEIPALELNAYYVHWNKTKYDLMLEYVNADDKKETRICKNLTLEQFIREITCPFRYKNEKTTGKKILEILENSDISNISENPLYISATEKEDLLMQNQLRLYYRIATEPEVRWLSKVLGQRILPSLPEEYDKNYVVDSDTIKISLLTRSGYVILHRPYFGMKGSTHSKWTLNPFSKTGVDAAEVAAESISFSEYLALFQEEENKKGKMHQNCTKLGEKDTF